MATSQEKISVYSLADLKNTSDDAIPNYLNSLRFKQSHTLTDVRLALGYSAFLIAAACFLWDYQFGFQSTKYLTAAAVAVYTVVNSGLTLWIWLVERGAVYVGTAPSGETVRITTETKKNVPQYNVTVEVQPKGSGKPQTFKSMLSTTIPCVGLLDPKRAASKSDAYTPEMLDALAGASASVAGSTTETAAETTAETTASDATGAGSKKGKRRKA